MTNSGSNEARVQEIRDILERNYEVEIFNKIIFILNESEDSAISEIKDYFLDFYARNNESGGSYKLIYLEKLKFILKNLTRDTSQIMGLDLMILQETVFYDPLYNVNSVRKLDATHQVFSIFPNLKSFYFDTLSISGKILFENKIRSIPNGTNFILNDNFDIVTRHSNNGNSFFLSIHNGKFITSPDINFAELYPIIVKEIFEKTGILDSQALQSYNPIFEDQNQAEKFLILLYKLARANDLLTLTEAQKKQITSLFSNIKNLTPQEISMLDGIISKEEFSLNQLEKFYKEELSLAISIEEQINNITSLGSSNPYPELVIENIKSVIFSIIDNSDEKTYKDFFKKYLNDLLETDFDFSQANITKENSQSFLKFTLLYSKSEIEDNLQFKNNLTKFLEIIATRTNIIELRNNQTSDSQKTLDAINDRALINSQNFQEINKRKFQISISSLAISTNLFSANSSQNKNQFGAGVFAKRVEEDPRLDEISQLPENFNQSPNYAHRSFLNEVLGDDNYASEFAAQAGENMNAIIHQLFFNSQNEELRNLLGNQKYSELQEKISQSTLLCVPTAPGSSKNTASFQFENTYGDQSEINVGAVLDDKTLSLGIFNGVKLKLGLRVNPDGSKEIGLFDNNNKLLIDSQSLTQMYEKSGIDINSLVNTIARFGSLNSKGNGQASYFESDSTTFSLRCLNGKWYLGIFQSKKVQEVQKDQEGQEGQEDQEDQEGQNILEFKGAIRINKDDLSKIIAIRENTDFSKIVSSSFTMETNPNTNQRVEFLPSDSLSRSSSLTNSVESSRGISLESEEARLLPDSSRLESNNEDDQIARCCCGLFSRVNKRILEEKFSDFRRDFTKPLGKIKLKVNLKNLTRCFYR